MWTGLISVAQLDRWRPVTTATVSVTKADSDLIETRLFFIITSPGGVRSIVMSMTDCPSVCLFDRLSKKTTPPNFTKFSGCVAYDCNSIHL